MNTEDYKLDFGSSEYTFDDIITVIYKHCKSRNINIIERREGFLTDLTWTGNFIGYYKLHKKFPEIIEYQDMIVKYGSDKDMAQLGAIMLRNLIEK